MWYLLLIPVALLFCFFLYIIVRDGIKIYRESNLKELSEQQLEEQRNKMYH